MIIYSRNSRNRNSFEDVLSLILILTFSATGYMAENKKEDINRVRADFMIQNIIGYTHALLNDTENTKEFFNVNPWQVPALKNRQTSELELAITTLNSDFEDYFTLIKSNKYIKVAN